MVSILLSVTFACGLVIAVAHVLNKSFIAPAYDVAANLTAFSCAVAASSQLGHWAPALLSAGAIGCWLVLARRTIRARHYRVRRPTQHAVRQPRFPAQSEHVAGLADDG